MNVLKTAVEKNATICNSNANNKTGQCMYNCEKGCSLSDLLPQSLLKEKPIHSSASNRAGLVIGHTGHFPGGPTHFADRMFFFFY